MKKMLFIFNPKSGKGLIKNNLLDIIQVFSNAGFEIEVYPTKKPFDAKEYLKSHEGRFDVVVCSGGDGTLNEVAGTIRGFKESKPPIGYIPSGSTNDFASSLNIPKDMIEAARHIADGEIFKCDIGLFNEERTFNYVAAFGAFTEVSYETSQNMKNIFGHQAYLFEGAKSISNLKPYKAKVISEEMCFEDSFSYGMVSNTISVGGMKGIAGPDIDLQDGLFEVTLVREMKNPLDFQQVITGLVNHNYDNNNMFISFKTQRVRFEFEENVKWTLDGEFGGEVNIADAKVLPSAVDYIVKK